MAGDAVTRAWERFWWLVPLLVTGVFLSVFWSHATPHRCFSGYWLSGDSGIAVYNAWQVADGRTLYADFFEYRTPFFFFVWGALQGITGPSAAVAQWATIASVTATATIMSVCVHRLGAGKLVASAGCVAAAVIMFAIWPYPLPQWLSWVLVALCSYSLIRAFDAADPDRGWLLRAGMFAGLHVMTWQSHGLALAAGATLGIALVAPRGKLAHAVIFVAGGLLIALPFFVYLIALGALGEGLWSTLVWTNKHYHNDWIKGQYPFAPVVETFQKYGFCKSTGSGWLNTSYMSSLLAIPAIAIGGFLASVGALARHIVGAIRRKGEHAARSGPARALILVATAGAAGFAPSVVFVHQSDIVHTAFASVGLLVPLIAILARAHRGRLRRISGHAVVALLFVIVATVSIDRHVRWHPFAEKFRDFDGFVKGYAGAAWMEKLSEPGDTIVHMPYGGWQYLSTHRHSGVRHTAVFTDETYTPEREWTQILQSIRDRQPTLIHFGPLRGKFLQDDPSLGTRYFFNGRYWERREPPLAHDTLSPAYRVVKGHEVETALEMTQNGQQLSAAVKQAGKTRGMLQGSVRGNRVFLTRRGEILLLRRQPDGALIGTWQLGNRTLDCRLEPRSP